MAADTVTPETPAVEALTNGNGTSNGNGHASNGQASFLTKVDQPIESAGEQLGFAAAAVPVEVMEASNTTNLFDICPECGTASFAYEEGCKKCYGCGYSEC